MVDWYEYPTNYSNGTIADTPGAFFLQYPSYILNNWLGLGILTIFWIFILIINSGSGSKKAMLSASFITFIFSIFFARLGLINPIFIIIFIVLTIVSLIGSKEEHGL